MRDALRIRVGPAPAEAPPSSPPVVVGNSDSGFAAPAPEKPGIKVVTTLEELDAQLKLVDEAGQRSDDDLRKVLASFEFGLTQNVTGDTYGETYRQQQHDLYLTISGATAYAVENERSEFLGNPEETARQPFPYYTQSAQTVGDQLMALGYIIKTMNLPSGSKILEFGPGWGNTTITLARMGYAVTAVDIESKFLELIQCRAKMLRLSVQTICGSFGPIYDSNREPEKFDAVLFFESFHHCADHLKLIRELPTMLKEGGMAVFASEPITEAFPLPWGVRMDGMSVWSIRRFKWLELGFKESYFLQTMQQNGWTVNKHVCPETHLGVIFVAKRGPITS
jgi:2-polyprenyl-3-methyl-5-hydroxy-6-metoxy-1,4-benzoquinol methylase